MVGDSGPWAAAGASPHMLLHRANGLQTVPNRSKPSGVPSKMPPMSPGNVTYAARPMGPSVMVPSMVRHPAKKQSEAHQQRLPVDGMWGGGGQRN